MDENLYYKGINKSNVDPYRLSQQYNEDPEHSRPKATKAHEPPFLFKSGETLLAMTEKYNVRVIHHMGDPADLAPDDDRPAGLRE